MLIIWKTLSFLIIELSLLTPGSCLLSKRFNSTALLLRKFSELTNYPWNTPETKDTSYLSDERYIHENLIDIFKVPYKRINGDEQIIDRKNRHLMQEYQNLCEITIKRTQLNDPNYEYQPPHFHEIFCKDELISNENQQTENRLKKKCVYPGFHCIQRTRTLFMLRRKWDSSCWEPYTKEIASGCDCMWPVSILGDISTHFR